MIIETLSGFYFLPSLPTYFLELTLVLIFFPSGNYVLQYLSSRVGLADYVTRALVQLVARISKHGWFDSDKNKGFLFRDILDEVSTFLQVRFL